MRICAAFLLVGTLTAGEAAASSFVTAQEVKGNLSRSIIVLGETPPAQPRIASAKAGEAPELAYPLPWERGGLGSQPSEIRVISRSIIAMGEPPVAFEQVAAIQPSKPKRGPRALPMVIRGGIIGDAFSRPALPAAPVVVEAEPNVVAPQEEKPLDPNSKERPPEPAAPPPQPPPNLPKLRGVE